jgi:FixJ family two-component response regulator
MSESQGNIIAIDDDRSVRRSLERLFRSHGYPVVTFSSAEEFLNCTPPPPPACAILDLTMPGLNGLELQKQLLDNGVMCGIVFLTGHGDLESGVTAMKQGAVDFLTKPIDEDRLLTAAEMSLAGQRQLLEQNSAIGDARSRLCKLTAREHDVMELVVAGRLNKLIAVDLGISGKTVKAHRANVMAKTGVKSVADLVRLYIASQEGSGDEEPGQTGQG